MAYLDHHYREMAKWAHQRLENGRRQAEEEQRRAIADLGSGLERSDFRGCDRYGSQDHARCAQQEAGGSSEDRPQYGQQYLDSTNRANRVTSEFPVLPTQLDATNADKRGL